MPTFSRRKTFFRRATRRRPAIALLLVSLLTLSLFWISSSTGGDGPPQAEAAENVVLTVDAGKQVYPFKDTIRGVGTNNWNWLWSGLWDRGGGNSCCAPGKTDAIIDATSYLEPGIIRFAGGLWANRVGWSRNSSAPDDGAWTYRDPQSGQSYNYTHSYKPAMIAAFQDFRTKLGSQAMIQVNICDNNIKMWQDMLRFTNIERNYDFEYWELGNEQSLDSCGLNPTSYAQRYAAYQTALKQVDPSIKIMGPVAHQPYFGSWEDALVDRMGDDLDVLAWHWYQLSEWTSNTGSFAYQGGSLEALMAWGGAVGACQDGFGCPGNPNSISAGNLGRWTYRRGVAEQKMNYIKSNYKRDDPTLETAITEFGVHASAHTHPVNGNHTAAIWLADVLGRWAYNGLDIITYYSLEDGSTGGGNSRGLLGTGNNSRIDVRPTYYAEFMYARYFGDMMVQSSTSDPEQKVVVWASTDSDDPGKLKLMLVNLSDDNASAQIRVNGFTPRSGQAYVMRSNNPLSMSDPGSFTEHSTTINGVRIPDYEVGNPSVFRNAVNSIRPVNVAASNNFNYSIPPYSVVALTLSGNAAPPQNPTATPTQPSVTPQPTATPVNPAAVQLRMSKAANRSNSAGLNGGTVNGDIFVSVSPDANVVSSTFYIDDATMSRSPLRLELLPVFDLMGTSPDGSALPLNTRTLSNGVHTVTARIGLRDGTAVVRTGSFTVNNGGATPTPTASPTPASSNVVARASTGPDRSSPFGLQGATVAGQVHVWAHPATDLRQVQFFVDDRGMAGSPHQTENITPFDLAGTEGNGLALPFDTASLSDGTHTVTMAVTLQNGRRSVVHTTFTVKNAVAAPSAAARVSNSSNRNSPRALNGATVSGDVYVWAEADPDVVSVSFFIDDRSMTGAPHQTENIGPFDMSGTHWTGSALAFDTASLSNGTHTLTMQPAFANGSTSVAHTAFTVRN